jgi:hypothetical protein
LANEYISQIDDVWCPGVKAVLYCRVSARSQDRKGNLDDQQAYLERELTQLGFEIVAVKREIASGWKEDRESLIEAATEAVKLGAILVAASTDPFLRSDDFKSDTAPGALPEEADYQELARATLGVTLATVLSPDMHWRTVRSHQTKEREIN